MKSPEKLHEEAMALADEADLARLQGDWRRQKELIEQACERERRAALKVVEEGEGEAPEPTRSVLLRSAASLAAECGQLDEAERLISILRRHRVPAWMDRELRDLSREMGREAPNGSLVPPINDRDRVLGSAVQKTVETIEDFMAEALESLSAFDRDLLIRGYELEDEGLAFGGVELRFKSRSEEARALDLARRRFSAQLEGLLEKVILREESVASALSGVLGERDAVSEVLEMLRSAENS